MEMMKYSAPFRRTDGTNVESWGLLPLAENCPFVDAVWNPDEKSLIFLLKSTKEYFINQAMKKDNGDVLRNPDKSLKTREVRYDKYYEHVLTDPADIEFFMRTHVVNNVVLEEKKLEA